MPEPLLQQLELFSSEHVPERHIQLCLNLRLDRKESQALLIRHLKRSLIKAPISTVDIRLQGKDLFLHLVPHQQQPEREVEDAGNDERLPVEHYHLQDGEFHVAEIPGDNFGFD